MRACPELELLEPYAVSPPQERASSALHAHVSSCARCRDSVEEIRRNLSLAERLGERERGADTVSGDPADAPAGYRILRELGRGGMGTVFEALHERTGRRVALKFLDRSALPSAERERGFRREVRALSRLRHPNLAAILDAGHGPGGRPYLVLELVEGLTLQRHLEATGASRAQRVALLETLARALASAHQRGVIHRDLKPSNVIVDAEGRPKLLDFGLARLLELDEDEPALDSLKTRSTRIQGSLPYMSPEQVRADAEGVDVRTDVYSLGVLGYEMLLGRLPYDAPWRNVAAAARVIAETSPLPPRALDPRFPADLATILRKALEKDPALRYGSALELAEDLARYSRGLPISARPARLSYQLATLVRRHKLASGLVATLVLGALGAALALGTLYAQAERERRVADREREIADLERAQAVARGAELAAALDWLDRMIGAVDPFRARGAEVKVLEVLEVLEESELALERGELDLRPAVEAAVRRSLGSSWLALGRPHEAERDLERALALREAESPPDPLALAALRSDLGRVRASQGRYAEASATQRQALADLERAGLEGDLRLIRVRSDLAAALCDEGRLEEAERELADALEALGPVADRSGMRAVLLAERARIEEARGRWAESAALRREVLDLRVAIFGDEHVHTAYARQNLAGVLARSGGDRREIAELQGRSLAVLRERLPHGHPTISAAVLLAATLHTDKRKLDQAIALYSEGIEGLRAVHGDVHPLVGQYMHNLGYCLVVAGRAEEGAQIIEESIDILAHTLPEGHPQHVQALSRLAAARVVQRRFDEAASILREVRERAAHDPALRHAGISASVLEARLAAERGDPLRAAEIVGEAIARERSTAGTEPTDVATLLQMQARHLVAADELEAACAALAEAHALRRGARGADDPAALELLESWAEVAPRACDLAAVTAALAEALALAALSASLEARLRLALGTCELADGDLKSAERDLLRAHDLFGAMDPPPPGSTRAVTALAELYSSLGDDAREAEFRALLDRAPLEAPR